MGGDTDRLEELQARIAWAYYKEGQTQAGIAERYGLTRARVNRLLQDARETGLVQITVSSRLASCVELEWRLQETFGLARAMVVPTPARERQLYEAVGEAAAAWVGERLRDGQSLGLGWGKTLGASVDALPRRPQGDISVVSLFGGLPHSHTTNPYDIASRYARRLGAARCYYIAAPMYTDSPATRATLVGQPMFTRVYERAAEVDMALVGVGDLTARSTNVALGALSHEQWHSLLEAGAVGELFGHFLDAAGNPVDHPLNRCFTGPSLERLRAIPIIIAASGGMQKTAILRAVLLGRYLTVLATDEQTAAALLDHRPTEESTA